MKLEYDKTSGAFTIRLNDDRKNAGSKMITENCILDFDQDGNVIAVEILNGFEQEIDFQNVELMDVSDPAYQEELIKRIKSRSSKPVSGD